MDEECLWHSLRKNSFKRTFSSSKSSPEKVFEILLKNIKNSISYLEEHKAPPRSDIPYKKGNGIL
jgi:hypothetical protein